MTFLLTWLPDVLRSQGLKVALVPGWENRGRGEMGDVLGVLCHHTVGARQGNMPSLRVLTDGRAASAGVAALAGPLSQLGLGRDGTYYVVAAGRANHAGAGTWQGISSGNTHFIGIEAENAGGSEAWPDVQMDAYRHGVAAILRFIGRGPEFCAAHKEYAPVRKPNDPQFDMDAFRADVGSILSGSTAPLAPIPNVDAQARPTLRRGSTGEFVTRVQQALGVTGPAIFGPKTEATVRAFQRAKNLVPDGIVGPKTWLVLIP
jgi:hypothetical protein